MATTTEKLARNHARDWREAKTQSLPRTQRPIAYLTRASTGISVLITPAAGQRVRIFSLHANLVNGHTIPAWGLIYELGNPANRSQRFHCPGTSSKMHSVNFKTTSWETQVAGQAVVVYQYGAPTVAVGHYTAVYELI